MVDFILGLFLAALLVRGWVRGFVREVLDLVGLVVGLWIAFRLSAPLGNWLTSAFGAGPEVARIGAGIILFILFGLATGVAAHYLSKVMRLPGLNMINRVGGAAVAFLWGLAIVLVLVNLARVFPLPDDWKSQLSESTVAQTITGSDALPQRVFEGLLGDSVLAAVATIQDLFGTGRVVPDPGETEEIPAAGDDEIRQDRDEADGILSYLNEMRAGLGLAALLKTGPLTQLAEDRATSMYVSGRLYRADCLGPARDGGASVIVCEEVVALAGTARGGFEGMKESTTAQASLAKNSVDRAGISVVEGPTGRLLVIVLAG